MYVCIRHICSSINTKEKIQEELMGAVEAYSGEKMDLMLKQC